MIIHFHEPPPAQRVGGLDAAIRSLQSALEALGHTVLVNPDAAAPAPDAVHFHGLWQPSFRTVGRRYLSQHTPFVVSPHGMLEPWAWRHKRWKKLPYWHLVEKPWVRHASCVLATAANEARRLAKFLPHTRIETLPLGLTGTAAPAYEKARELLGWKRDERVLLFLSRIHEKKGLDLLLEALTEVQIPQPCRLVIVGPDEQPEYAARCRQFSTTHADRLPAIEWKGPIWREDRWPYLQGADLFCLPTHSENFGLAVLEACQVGTQTLTTTETPWAEVLPRHGGLIATPTIESIIQQLRAFSKLPPSGPSQRESLSKWSHETHAWDILAPRYVGLYQNLQPRHTLRRDR